MASATSAIGLTHRKFVDPIRSKCIRASIGPDIAPIATMATKIDIIDVFAATILPDKDKFVLTAIE